MTVVTIDEAKKTLEDVCSKAVDEREPVFIKRHGEEDVVLLAADEYESIAETSHLLASPENAARLLAALASTRHGATEAMTVGELRAAVGI